MRKILTVLFGLLFLQNAYCDSLDEFSSEIRAFMDKKMDESALRALCKKLLSYAYVHNIKIVTELDGELTSLTSGSCEKASAIRVPDFIMDASMQILEHTPENNSQSVQNVKVREAFAKCEPKNMLDAEVVFYKKQGYNFMFDRNKTIIDCSETDNRCIVNRPISKGGIEGYYSVCCRVKIASADERKVGNDVLYVGSPLVERGSKEGVFVPEALTLKDYDYACQPINK